MMKMYSISWYNSWWCLVIFLLSLQLVLSANATVIFIVSLEELTNIHLYNFSFILLCTSAQINWKHFFIKCQYMFCLVRKKHLLLDIARYCWGSGWLIQNRRLLINFCEAPFLCSMSGGGLSKQCNRGGPSFY